VDVPADALHGDWANLAIEADGVPLGRAHLQLFGRYRYTSPKPSGCLRRAADLAVEPAIIPVDAAAGRTVDVHVRNNSPEIQSYAIEPAGEGFQFLPAKAELIPARLWIGWSRFVFFRMGRMLAARLCAAFSGGAKLEMPTRFSGHSAGGRWLGRGPGCDGVPEWVLENQKVRAVFSAQDGGRWLEFVWKVPRQWSECAAGERALVGTGLWRCRRRGDAGVRREGLETDRAAGGDGSQADRGTDHRPAGGDARTGRHNESACTSHGSRPRAVYAWISRTASRPVRRAWL